MNRPDERTLEQLAEQALAVQDACNLCGVAQSFAAAMRRLMALGGTTEQINRNPITQVWVDKLAQLAGTQSESAWALGAYGAVQRLAEKGKEPPVEIAQAIAGLMNEDGRELLREVVSLSASPSFDEALAAWLERSQARIDAEHAARKLDARIEARKLSLDPGGVKFVRVVATDGPSRSALAFVERATGDVYKPDSWKRPAKGARGNIYRDARGLASMGELYR